MLNLCIGQIVGLSMAYFEGQKDALEGEVRIAKNSSNQWEWVKSPWDDRTKHITTNFAMSASDESDG